MDCQSLDESDLRFCDPPAKNKSFAVGRPFDVSPSQLSKIGIPAKNFAPLERDRLEDFVFATGADEHYFHPAMDAIGNVQRFLPNHTIYFYDLSDNRSPKIIQKVNL